MSAPASSPDARDLLAVVITTIQSPTPCLLRLLSVAAGYRPRFLVIGDRKGPAQFDAVGAEFWSLEAQLKLPFELVARLPIGHYVRKNLGYLLAIQGGATCIYETDDDNAPLPHWSVRERQTHARPISGSGWLNVYSCFTDALIWPRGLPLTCIHASPAMDAIGTAAAFDAPIQQGLANGSPDVDALWRLIMDSDFHFDVNPSVRLAPGLWCPWNSQSTWWWPPAYPLMYLPSFCTFRMTDIWRSLVAQRCLWQLGHGIVFHAAEVVQDRNAHDLMRDFHDELPGYEGNAKIASLLNDTRLEAGEQAVHDNLVRCYETLVTAGFFPTEELLLVRAWIADCRRLALDAASSRVSS
jgi:hypothetical protein